MVPQEDSQRWIAFRKRKHRMIKTVQLIQPNTPDPPGSGADTLALATQEVLRLIAMPSIESVGTSKDRIWFVIFQRAIDEYQAMGYQTHPHLAWLGDHYSLVHTETWGEIQVYVYNK